MSEEKRANKWAKGFGKTKVRSLLPIEHPVVQGVMEAREILGGDFPEHVKQICIVPEIKVRQDGAKVKGRCFGSGISGSKIIIYAGSITDKRTDSGDIKFTTTKTTLHEISHSETAEEIHSGCLDASTCSRTYHETRANNFANQALNPDSYFPFRGRRCK